MKLILSIAALFTATLTLAQSTSETQILKLSADIFKWETENKTNLLDSIFSDQFFIVNAAGETQTKAQYLTRLRSGNFVHDSIEIEKNTATVVDNTGIITGKGRFVVSISGKKVTLRLSYMEIFTRPNTEQGWKIVAMKASTLQD